MSTQDVYERLLHKGWNAAEAGELLFLFLHMEQNNEVMTVSGPVKKNFWDLQYEIQNRLAEVSGEELSHMLEQIVKCIVHNLPYEIMLYCSDSSCANEVRRLIEDSGDWDLSSEVAQRLHNPKDIYEFRRMFKLGIGAVFYQQVALDFVAAHGWIAMSALIEAMTLDVPITPILDKWELEEFSAFDMWDDVREMQNERV